MKKPVVAASPVRPVPPVRPLAPGDLEVVTGGTETVATGQATGKRTHKPIDWSY